MTAERSLQQEVDITVEFSFLGQHSRSRRISTFAKFLIAARVTSYVELIQMVLGYTAKGSFTTMSTAQRVNW